MGEGVEEVGEEEDGEEEMGDADVVVRLAELQV